MIRSLVKILEMPEMEKTLVDKYAQIISDKDLL